ncbi:hypothetical protein [Burkholderia anthina]|uniref:hypothetical protein n=1 Tax=Burkholderia anthina TaxID=179879 RepID=UPI001AA09BED|nr:hypothetical protein [Burkholderia anthina]QTD95308.1 hypothetical protein J4G50_38270 [Burkholderia anthina]
MASLVCDLVDLPIKPGGKLFELRELHRPGALLGRRMQRRDPLEYLSHVRRLRRICETLRLMPLCECCQARPQCIDRQGFGVVGKVPRDGIGARRQEAAPFNLEMPDRRLVTATGIFARRGFDVAIDSRHGSWVQSGNQYRSDDMQQRACAPVGLQDGECGFDR